MKVEKMTGATGGEGEVIQDHLPRPGDDHQLGVQVELPALGDHPRPGSSALPP